MKKIIDLFLMIALSVV